MNAVEIASSALSAPPRNDKEMDSRFRGNDRSGGNDSEGGGK